MKIDIIGAGIGGLTTAIALEQKGFTIRIFEQAKEIKLVGAGIILANNAMQVFEKLGLKEIIEEKGNTISSMKITTPSLNVMSNIDLSYFEKKNGVKNTSIHRGTLQQLLIDKLNNTDIFLNHKLSSITKNENGYALEFENGEQTQSTILLGADGIHSEVRKSLFPPATLRHANQICWRGVTSYQLPLPYQHELNEAWGKANRVGFVQIATNTVYWYGLTSFKKSMDELSNPNIEDYFSEYHPMIQELISSSDKTQINTAEITDLKPIQNWHKENVCLLGDAAHATTPNMGQGACQAIEDAYVLATCLEKYDTQQAFVKFQAIRTDKAHQVVKMSWMIGKLSHLSNPILRGIRDLFIRLTPASINRKQSERLFKLPTL